MPRIRTIKPEFWSDYRLARDLTRDQRLLYIGLWNEADDAGRLQAHPGRIAGALFPYDDDIHGAFIEDSLRALAEAGKLVLYDVDGEPYAEIVNFLEHQKINRPTASRIPPPDSDLAEPHGELSEDSRRAHRGKGKERKGKEQGKESEENKENTPSATAAAVGDFLQSIGSRWKLKQPIREWAASLDAEPKYAGVDIPYQIQRCAEWHVEKGKSPSSPTNAIHNWLKRASADVKPKKKALTAQQMMMYR